MAPVNGKLEICTGAKELAISQRSRIIILQLNTSFYKAISSWHAVCCLLLSRIKTVTRLTSVGEKKGGFVMNQMAAMVKAAPIPAEHKKPVPQENERGAGPSLEEPEIGLLDIVVWDAIVNDDAVCRQRERSIHCLQRDAVNLSIR